jgi:hypothetical protein
MLFLDRIRTPLILLVATAAVGIVASPAGAASRPERFVAYVKAVQTTEWEEPAWTLPVGKCSESSGSASGTERTVLRTKPVRVIVLRAAGGLAMSYGPLRKPMTGLPGKGSIKSSYVSRTRHTPGSCEPGPVTGADRDKDESCEASPMHWFVQINAAGGKATPLFIENEGLKFPTLGLEDCVIHRPDGAPSHVTGVPARLPASRVFDRDEEFVVVTGRRSFRDTQELGYATRTMTTTVRWTLRLRRAK